MGAAWNVGLTWGLCWGGVTLGLQAHISSTVRTVLLVPISSKVERGKARDFRNLCYLTVSVNLDTRRPPLVGRFSAI